MSFYSWFRFSYYTTSLNRQELGTKGFKRWKRQKEEFLATSKAQSDECFVYHPLPNAETPTIRLLTLLPGKEFEEVHCEIHTVNLHAAKYEALSYCWGDDACSTSISCHGVPTKITRNLKKALHDLRYADRPRVLWIDAICINQSDISEKEHQVSIMGEIYRCAHRVIIHLGMDIPGLRLAVEALQSLHDLYQDLVSGSRDLADVLDEVKQARVGGTRRHMPLMAKLVFAGILSYVPYFSRMWVAQEVMLAQDISIIYGSWKIEWDVFANCMAMRAFLTVMGCQAPVLHTAHDMAVLRLIALREGIRRDSKESRSLNLDLLSLLCQTRTLTSTNPVDKVYGVFGVTNSNLRRMGLQPDYSISAETLYLDVAFALLKESTNLDILSIAHPNVHAHGRPLLPSWVPDWSYSARYPRSLIFRTIDYGAEYARRQFRASGDSIYRYRAAREDSQKCLLVRGYLHDQISDMTIPIKGEAGGNTWEMLMEEVLVLAHSSETQFLDLKWISAKFFALDGMGQLIQDYTRQTIAMLQLQFFLRKHSITRKMYRPTGERIAHAYMRTMCSDYVPYEPITALRAFQKWLWWDDWPIHDLWEELMEFNIPFAVLRPAKPDFGTLTGVALGRRLIWTCDGYLGLAPPGARKGDQIVLLEGGRVPYVLRKGDGHSWQFIGECYIHGIMYGEAFDSGKCVDMVLV